MTDDSILSIGDGVRPGEYRVHSSFKHVVNFVSRDSFVSLVKKEIGAGPLNIVVNGINLNDIRSLGIENRYLYLNQKKFAIDTNKIYNSKIDVEKIDPGQFSSSLKFFENYFISIAPSKSLAFLLQRERKKYFRTILERKFVQRMETGFGLILINDFTNGIKTLKGLGFGLTPGGDDFICGMLIALNIIKKIHGLRLNELPGKIYSLARGNNQISNAALYCARNGMLSWAVKDLVSAMFYYNRDAIIEHTNQVTSIGATSGADLCTGFLLEMKQIDNFVSFHNKF